MMMRSLSAFLALAMLLALSACGAGQGGVDPYSVRSFDPDQQTQQNLTQSSARAH